jgi:hypothetical protein
MISESEIIITAKRDDTPAVDCPLSALRAFGDAAYAIKLLDLAFLQRETEVFHLKYVAGYKAWKGYGCIFQ